MTYFSHIQTGLHIEHALKYASKRTGADFDYLLKTAMRESSLKSDAKSNTSSAKGLFQFIEQTWLSTVKKSGSEFGLGHLTKAISQKPDGSFEVADPATRSAILALRDDPRTSALMAGAYTRDSAQILHAALGRAPKQGELYIAHFMGKTGAVDLISLASRAPNASAAEKFPVAAASNRSIFYHESGRPRTVREVYDNLVSKHGTQSVQMARLAKSSAQKSDFMYGDAGAVQFSSQKHLSSHFKPSRTRGGFSGLFGTGSVAKTKPATNAVSTLHKRPAQSLLPAVSQASTSSIEKTDRVHLVSTSVKAYQDQQANAKTHNLFSSPSLRGTYR